MTDYAIWKPEHDGHAPPNWREGMKVAADGLSWTAAGRDWGPNWWEGQEYKVPAEALNSPNDDASGDVDAWKRDEAPVNKRLALRGFIQIIKDFPPEMLAEEGITLAPERDWATELWADLFTIRGMTAFAKSIRGGRIDDEDRAAIELLRTRFEQMIAERSKRDA